MNRICPYYKKISTIKYKVLFSTQYYTLDAWPWYKFILFNLADWVLMFTLLINDGSPTPFPSFVSGVCVRYVSNMMTSFGVILRLTNGKPEGRLLWSAELFWRTSGFFWTIVVSLSNVLLLISTLVPLQHLYGGFLGSNWFVWFCFNDESLSLLCGRVRPGTQEAEVPSICVFSVLDCVPVRVCGPVLLIRHLQNQSDICLRQGYRLKGQFYKISTCHMFMFSIS